MLKRGIVVIGTTLLLIVLLLWGNLMFAYCAFKVKGIEVVKIGYFLSEDLSANINIIKDDKIYNVTITNIRPSSFASSSHVGVSEINGYTLITKGCEPAKYSGVSFGKEKKPIGTTWTSYSRINFKKDRIFNHLFNVEINNIYNLIDNIDIIEQKLLEISTTDIEYFADLEEEIYFKRIKIDAEIEDSEIEKDCFFVFKNPDCNCSQEN